MAEDLLDTIGQLFGPLRGGLAYAVIFVGALLAATTGVVAASVISMGLISLPIMLRYGYDRRLATGVIAASGTLAQIIPAVAGADHHGRPARQVRSATCTRAHSFPASRWPACMPYTRWRTTIVKPQWAPALPAGSADAARTGRHQRRPVADRAGRHRGGRRRRLRETAHGRIAARRDARHRDERRHRRRVLRGGAEPSSQARPALEDRRARHVRADPAAGADLPRAGHDLPRRRDADRRRCDGCDRRADHGARPPSADVAAAEAGDGHDGQAVDVRRVHPGRRARVQPDLLRRQRPRVGRAPADEPSRAASSAS